MRSATVVAIVLLAAVLVGGGLLVALSGSADVWPADDGPTGPDGGVGDDHGDHDHPDHDHGDAERSGDDETAAPSVADDATDATLTRRWVADTRTSVDGNHHRAAAFEVDGEPHLAVPLNGDDEDCRVVTTRADGEVRWTHEVPPDDCHPHAVGDLTVDRFPADEPAILVATGEERVLALDAATGDERFRHGLPEFGYSPPTVLDASPRTLVVADFLGTVVAVDETGTERWSHDLDGYVWSEPLATGGPDGGSLAVVAGGQSGESGVVQAFTVEGDATWSIDRPRPVYEVDEVLLEDGPAVVAAGRDGSVLVADAATGTPVWTRTFDDWTRVSSTDDVVYVTDADGTVRRLNGTDGTTEWSQSVGEDLDAPTPVALATLDDGQRAPVVATSDGVVAVLSPSNGSVLATHDVGAALYAPPTVADLTGDGSDEVAIVASDGRTIVLEYRAA